MAQTIQIKRSTGSSAPSTLANGELAYLQHANNKKLYIGRPGGGTGDIDVIGGKDFTDKADAALARTGGAMTGAITTNSTFDGRDVATDGTKLDGIEAGADVTDATNVAAAGALMLTGGTMTGDLQFGDTNKIKLGASGDFQLVHTTTGGSFIIDQGPGDLKLVTNGTGVVINGGGSTGGSATTNLATFHSNSSAASGDEYYVQLNHGVNSNQKFRTASGGVEITGNIVVSGTVDGRDVATDGTKLDTIATNADVTPSWVPSSNPSYLTSETFTASDAGNFSFSGDTMSTSGSTMTLDPANSGSSGTVVIEGGLTVKGTTTTVNSTSINLEDNIIILNNGETNAPSADAGLEVERGTAVNAYLVWDESTDRWSVALGGGSGNNNEILQSTMSPINVENVAIDGGSF